MSCTRWDWPIILNITTAGRLAQTLRLSQLYDLDLQRAVHVPSVGRNVVQDGLLPFNHPPLLAPLLGLLVSDAYGAAYVRWALLLTALISLIALVMAAL
jgi:hypothetical protein